MKLYERCIGFVNIITTTILDDQMTKIKVVGIENLWNFIVEAFLILITFINEKEYEFFEFQNLNFWNDIRNGETL
jgi:hypothetical protein